MAELYGKAYSKRLAGLSGRIGGTIELFFLQRMRRSAYFRDAQSLIDEYGPPKKVNALVTAAFESGKVIEQMVHASRFLEIGINEGHFIKNMAHPKNFGWGIYGVDINPAGVSTLLVDTARQNEKLGDCTEKTAFSADIMDMQALQFQEASFRIVLARHVLEHLPDPAKGIEEVVRVTEPGGIIQLSYPYEPVRGIAAVPSALAATGNPFDARKLHLHKLNPGKVARLFDPRYIFGDRKMLVFTPYPVWLHVLLRNDSAYNPKDYTPFYQRHALK